MPSRLPPRLPSDYAPNFPSPPFAEFEGEDQWRETAGELGRLLFAVLMSMRKNGMSQEALAAKAGVNAKTVSNIMRGKQWPEFQVVSRLVRASGLWTATVESRKGHPRWCDVDPDSLDPADREILRRRGRS